MRFVAAYRWIPVALLLLMTACYGRPPASEGDDPNAATTFAKSFGGDFDDIAMTAVETDDGGYAFVGLRGVSDEAEPKAAWIVRLDANGNVAWQNTFNEGVLGGLLGLRPYGIVAVPVAGGGFCLAGTVAGQPGDTGDLYVAFLDDQDLITWEHRIDSGGWNGFEVIASGDRGAFAHDVPIDVQPGPNQSCYVAGVSFAHLRDSFGIGITDGAGNVAVGGNFIDARSVITARVSSAGLDWLRRDTEGAFENLAPVDNSGPWSIGETDGSIGVLEPVALVSMRDGGVAQATYLKRSTGTSSLPGTLKLTYFDAAGSPTPLMRESLDDGLDAYFVSEAAGDVLLALDSQASNGDRLVMISRRGVVQLDRPGRTLSQPVAVEAYQDASGLRIAAFGRNSTTGATVQIFNAANGDLLNNLGVPGFARILAAGPLATPGRFVATARRDDELPVLLQLDLFDASPIVFQEPLDFFNARVAAGIAYRSSSSDLDIQIPEATTRSVRLSPTDVVPIGIVALSGDRFGVALRQGGPATPDTYVIVGRDTLESVRTFEAQQRIAKIDGVSPGRNGGAALLVRYSADGDSYQGNYAIAEIPDDGGQELLPDVSFRAGGTWDNADIRLAPDGGYAVMYVSGSDQWARIARIGSDGSLSGIYEYPGSWSDFDVLANGGFALAGYGFNGDHLFSVTRTDASGNIEWRRDYGIAGAASAPWFLPYGITTGIRETPDGALVVATTTRGLLESGYAGTGGTPLPAGERNITMVRLEADGTPDWVRVHGALLNETFTHLLETRDGGFLVSATSDSLGQPTINNDRLTNEAWLLRMGPDGLVAAGCNAFLAEFSGQILTFRDLQPPEGSAAVSGGAGPRPNGFAVSGPSSEFAIGSPPVVEARQCAGIAASSNTPVPEASLSTLTVNQAGSIDGLISSSPAGIFCGGSGTQACSRDFNTGSTAFLTVDDSSAIEFRGWGNGCVATSTAPNRCEVTVDGNRTVDVFFEPWDGSTATLTVDIAGAGRVIAVEPSGIDCYDDPTASDCTATYPLGQRVLLTVFELPGETFQGWGGSCSEWATSGTIRVTVDADQTCSALFSGQGFTPNYRLTTAITVNGAPPAGGELPGDILSAPAGADCGGPGADCAGDYEGGTRVRLMARPSEAYRFVGWTSSISASACDGSTATTIDVDVRLDIDCTADFRFVGPNLSLLGVEIRLDGAIPAPGGPFGGSATTSPAGLNCGSAGSVCEVAFARGSLITLIAPADTGYHFGTFGGDCAGSVNATSVRLDNDTFCIVNFATSGGPPTAALNMTVTGSGNVGSNPSGIFCGGDCSEAFPLGTIVSLTAYPSAGFVLTSWGGDCAGSGSMTQVTMSSARNCSADFAPITPTSRLTITVVGPGQVRTQEGGVLCPGDCQEDYPTGSNVNILAIPDNGQRLLNWSGICAEFGTGTDFNLNMFQDHSCTATFGP